MKIKVHCKAVPNSVFNSAVVPFENGFAGVFRCDDICRRMNIHRGFSDDGIDCKLDHEPIVFTDGEPDLPGSDYKYDPRVIRCAGRSARKDT
jgi:beta-1,4-mannooligosaccharide/beta-1,4-mannosyl-N-acetylglucosamine phosphorylase